jgi:serine/threonine protein kinase
VVGIAVSEGTPPLIVVCVCCAVACRTVTRILCAPSTTSKKEVCTLLEIQLFVIFRSSSYSSMAVVCAAELRHIVMEYVDGPDLYEYVREHVCRSPVVLHDSTSRTKCSNVDLTLYCRQGVLSEVHCRQVIEQISSALSYIHSKGIVHRDIKVGYAVCLLRGVCTSADR